MKKIRQIRICGGEEMKVRLGEFIQEFSVRNRAEEDIPVYSVTNSEGFCTGYFDKDVASNDRSTYKIVPRGCFAYNPSRINVGSVDWQRYEDKVIVSPLYVVFSVSDRLDPQYLYFFLKSNVALTYIRAAATGSVRDNLRFSMLQEFSIELRTIEEQLKVTQTLDRVQTLIKLYKRQLHTLDILIKARFVEMFGEQQATVKLSDVAEVTGGLTKNANRNKLPLRMPYLRVANVSFAKIDVTEMLDIGLTEDERTKTLLQFGDLLFVEGNGSPDQIGRVAVWHDEITPCVHQNHIIKARFDKTKMLPAFAMYYFMSQEGRDQIKRKAVSTSGLYTLSVSKIADFSLPCPSIAEQMEFDLFTTQVDKSKVVETIVRIRKHLASCGKARNLFRNQKLSHRNTRVQMHTFEYKVCA